MSLFKQGHALIVGVGGDLPNTKDDAQGLAELLREPGRAAYPSDQVQLLTGTAATRDKLLTAFDSLAENTTADSTVVFYFSGHGYRASTSMGEDYYLLPYGYNIQELYKTAISEQEFTDKLKAIPARKMLILLDCCHAGGVGAAKAPGLSLAKSPLPPGAVELLATGEGRVLIASSQEDELSYAGNPYSAFTLALIEALSGQGVAKKDGYVRVTDLALHAREVVPGRTRDKQHPILHFEDADNFVLAYYAGGEKQPKGLPFEVEPQIEPEPGVGVTFDQRKQTVHGSQFNVNGDFHGPLQQVDTGGAAYIGGGVNTGGGNFTGRDSIQITGDGNVIGNNSHSNVIKTPRGEISRREQTFQRLQASIAIQRGLTTLDKQDLQNELEELKADLTAGTLTVQRLSRYLRNIGRISTELKRELLRACADPTAGLGQVAQQVAARY